MAVLFLRSHDWQSGHVGSEPIPLKKSVVFRFLAALLFGRACALSCWAGVWGWWDELCEFPKVLGGRCEVEFVTGTTWAPKSKPAKAKDAFEVCKRHLDLLS